MSFLGHHIMYKHVINFLCRYLVNVPNRKRLILKYEIFEISECFIVLNIVPRHEMKNTSRCMSFVNPRIVV